MIKVALIEDTAEIREGIENFLNQQKDMACLFAADSVERFLKEIKSTPDVLLLDITLPGMSGLSGIPHLKEKFPRLEIIMITIHDDPNRIFEALCQGATGYLLKNTPFLDIKKSIEEIHRGGSPMSPQIARKVIHHFQNIRPAKSESPLSPKEKEIVTGLVDGLSYKMIADRLEITIETVRTHIKNIYQKLQVHSKAEVITKSLRGEI